jgi:hypothetical protein
MFDAIDEATERLGDVRANGTPDQRRAMRYRKEVGPATKQRIRATLRSALSDALDQQLVTVNVAKFANLPSGKRPKALVWTKERDLVLSDAEVVRRRSGRRVCRDCAKIWHLEFTPPVRPDVCDTCGGALFQRYNDSAERVTALRYLSRRPVPGWLIGAAFKVSGHVAWLCDGRVSRCGGSRGRRRRRWGLPRVGGGQRGGNRDLRPCP